MLPPGKDFQEDYTVDQELSDEIRYRLEHQLPSSPFPRWAYLIFLLPVLVPLFGIHFMVGVGLALFLLFVVNLARADKEGDTLEVKCPKCQSIMSKDWDTNIEYFKCHRCRIYAAGRDGS